MIINRGVNVMKKLKSIIAVALILVLTASAGIIAYSANGANSEGASPAAGGSGGGTVSAADGGAAEVADKDEVVYARLSSGGDVRNIYVVNRFTINKGGTFTDYGDYASVVNLTNLGPLTISNGEVSAIAESGNFFYQGNLSGNDLPWVYSIQYFLDGTQIQPENLAGASGALKIRLTSAPNDAIDGVFRDNYMQQITVTLDIYKCENIITSGASVANAGKNRLLVYTILPGSGADIMISADVMNFEMAGIEITAMPFSMSLDMPDIGGMLDDFVLLSDAIAQLNDGVSKLKDGAAEMVDGAVELTNGSSEFYSGLTQVDDGSSLLTGASAQIRNALSQISTALQSADGLPADSMMADLEQLPAGLAQLADTLAHVPSGISQLKEGYTQAYSALDGAIKDIPGYQISEEQITGLLEKADDEEIVLLRNLMESHVAAVGVKRTYELVMQVLASVPASLDNLSVSVNVIVSILQGISTQIGDALSGGDIMGQLQQLVDGIAELAANYTAFHEGLVVYTQGIGELSSAYGDLDSGIASLSGGLSGMHDGITELYDGTSEMADKTADMPDQIQNEVDSLLDGYMGGGFEPVSFTSSENSDVSFVQFVFKAEGIELPEIEAAVEDTASRATVWDRLIQLFKKD